jgi:hypothetical protein
MARQRAEECESMLSRAFSGVAIEHSELQ